MVTGELRKRGFRIKMQPMTKRVLVALAAGHGRVVPRETLFRQMWPGGVSTDAEHGLNTAMKKLRAALHDTPSQPRYIETIPSVGYRFIAEVKTSSSGADALFPVSREVSGRAAAAGQGD